MRPPATLAGIPGLAGVLQGDLYEPLPDSLAGRVDLLLANAPYVPSGSIRLMPPEARLYESRLALDGGLDGLDVLRRIVAGAKRWLAPAWTAAGGDQSQPDARKRCSFRAPRAGGPDRHFR